MIEQPTLWGDMPEPQPVAPPDRTCGQCAHLVAREYANTYWRCRLIETGELKVERASIKGDCRARRRKKDAACCKFLPRTDDPTEATCDTREHASDA